MTAKKPNTSAEVDAIRAPYIGQIDALKKRLENLVPTPPIGTNIQWFRAGHIAEDNIVPGIVTKHVRPGVVSVTVFPRRSNPQFYDNVMYVRDEQARAKGNPNTAKNGLWDYVRKSPPAKSDYALHEREISEQIERVEQDMKREVDRYADRQRILAQEPESAAN